ncbi:unnamed protein product, partial [Prorocentrum cordatum]
VKLGTHILTGERVAIKVLEKERIVEVADVERVAREIHILKLIRQCRHIIQLYEIIETPRQLYLIMEYAPGGELFDAEHGRAEEPEACRFLHQILAGVERVHSMRVVHRDLKPESRGRHEAHQDRGLWPEQHPQGGAAALDGVRLAVLRGPRDDRGAQVPPAAGRRVELWGYPVRPGLRLPPLRGTGQPP